MPKMGRPISITGPIADLAFKVGGLDVLASELKVAPRTIRYWISNDRSPSGPARILLEKIGKEHGIFVNFDSSRER